MALGTARIRGTLTSWNDDRGFGFISPENGPGSVGHSKTFVHIKEFPVGLTRRPQVGDTLTFELGRSQDGKPLATSVQVTGLTSTAARRHPASHRKSRATAYLPILFFVAGCLAVDAIWPLPIWVPAVYLVASILCFLAYARDKSAATTGGWRTQEGTLLLLGFCGGWPGAIVAQQVLRHKTKKASFRSAFWFSVWANVLILAACCTPVVTLFGSST